MATDDNVVAQQADDTEGHARRWPHNEPTPIEQQGEGRQRWNRPEGEDEGGDTGGFSVRGRGVVESEEDAGLSAGARAGGADGRVGGAGASKDDDVSGYAIKGRGAAESEEDDDVSGHVYKSGR